MNSLRALESVIVAYSGGVDSSLLAYYARKALGDKAKVVIAVSASLATDELDAAREQAEAFGWNLIEIQTKEIDMPEYQKNDEMRCYFCKKTLFTELEEMAQAQGIKHIAYGANMDDKQDFRPGQKAAREFSVVSPLQDALLSKTEIRDLAKQAGLPSWNRPQAACLSSRFPTFQPVTIEGLSQVDRAEHYLRAQGFVQLRVRHHGDLARIELDDDGLKRIANDPQLMTVIADNLRTIGFAYVTLDLDGYRQGSSNRFLQVQEAGRDHG